jgi:GMP synthase-like glutamine amidotransferase
MRILVFQHINCEHPAIFRDFLKRDAIEWDAIELDEGGTIPSLDRYDMLWVMGGPMDVWDVEEHPWLVGEKRAIRRWVRELKKPFLGVCLGHQLLADALGGTCGPQRPPEVGILDIELTEEGKFDPIFGGLPTKMKALQWHGVRVAQPPEDAVVLARSDVCSVQAMRIGDCTYSMQYHVEIEEDTIPNWGKVPAYEESLAKVRGPNALANLTAEAKPHMADFVANAWRLYRNFMDIARG